MEFIEVINKRKTVRDFQSKEVSNSILEYAISNAFKAPSHNHLRQWDFLVIQKVESKMILVQTEQLSNEITTSELESRFESEDTIMKHMYLEAIPKQKRMILNAPMVVLAVYKPKTTMDMVNSIYDLNCLASMWTSIQNFILSLAEHEVFGVTYIPQQNENIKKVFSIPQELEVAAVIPIGYEAPHAKMIRQKDIQIRERIHSEVW